MIDRIWHKNHEDVRNRGEPKIRIWIKTQELVMKKIVGCKWCTNKSNTNENTAGTTEVHVANDATNARHSSTTTSSFPMNPLKFEGIFNPIVARDWLTSMKWVFEVIPLSEEDKATYVAHMFRGPTIMWWTSDVTRMAFQGIPKY